MKKWIMKKLGITNHAEESMKIGEWIAEGFAKWINETMDKTDTPQNVHDVQKIKDAQWYDENESERDNHTVIDPLLKNVTHVIWEQQNKVLRSGKYEHPIHKDNHTAVEWMDHQMSELADALVYHECLIQTIKEVHELIGYAYHKSVDPEVDELLIEALNRLRKG